MPITDLQNESREGTFGGIRGLIRRVRSVEDFFKKKHDADAAVVKETAAGPSERDAQGLRLGFHHYHQQMPLHYPRYSKVDYQNMPEWQLDRLLADYGLPICGDVYAKRAYAISSFLFPDQL